LFRDYVFAVGWQYLLQRILESVSLTSIYNGFKEKHPDTDSPVSFKTYLNMDEFLDAVRNNDITRITRTECPDAIFATRKVTQSSKNATPGWMMQACFETRQEIIANHRF
jgi:hypothetical protein